MGRATERGQTGCQRLAAAETGCHGGGGSLSRVHKVPPRKHLPKFPHGGAGSGLGSCSCRQQKQTLLRGILALLFAGNPQATAQPCPREPWAETTLGRGQLTCPPISAARLSPSAQHQPYRGEVSVCPRPSFASHILLPVLSPRDVTWGAEVNPGISYPNVPGPSSSPGTGGRVPQPPPCIRAWPRTPSWGSLLGCPRSIPTSALGGGVRTGDSV